MTYPVFAAGQTLTASALNSTMYTKVIKTAETARASTTTFADDPDLTTATLAANGVYFIEFIIGASGLLAADIKFDWSVPASASGNRHCFGPGSAANDSSADNIAVRAGVHGYTTSVAYSGVRDSTNQFTVVERSLLTMAATPGPVVIRWAQVTSNATASRVHAGSLLRYRRVG